jgi:hypothetical protein
LRGLKTSFLVSAMICAGALATPAMAETINYTLLIAH